MSSASTRKGFARLPRAIFEDTRMSANHVGMLLYLQSHKPGWICKISDIRQTLSLSEDVTFRLLKELEAWGYLHRKHAMRNGKRAGLFITVLVDHLNPQNSGLVKSSKPPKTKLGNQGSYKESNIEGHIDCEVIDDGDVGGHDWIPLRVIGGNSFD